MTSHFNRKEEQEHKNRNEISSASFKVMIVGTQRYSSLFIVLMLCYLMKIPANNLFLYVVAISLFEALILSPHSLNTLQYIVVHL